MKEGLKAYAWAIAAMVVLALLLFGLGTLVYQAGRDTERVVHQAATLKAEKTFREALDREIKRGQDAAAALRTELLSVQTTYSHLEGKYRELSDSTPLVVYLPVRGPADPPAGATSAKAAAVAASGQAAPAGGSGGGGVGLSGAALWMWNSSLAGTDVPAGACGSADPADPACAADAGVALEDAWANHHINAKSCAADRVRYRALIDYLNRQPKAQTTP